MGLRRVHACENMSDETRSKFETSRFDFMRQNVEIAAQWLYTTKTGPHTQKFITVRNIGLPFMILFVYLWLYSTCGPRPPFQFLNLYTIGRTAWTGDQPVAKSVPTRRTTQTQNQRTQTAMRRVAFEPTTPVLERAKRVHALDCVATVIGLLRFQPTYVFPVPILNEFWKSVYKSLHFVLLQGHKRTHTKSWTCTNWVSDQWTWCSGSSILNGQWVLQL
jgi:hypothetical protein